MTPEPQKEYIITEEQLKDMVENGALGYSPYRASVADAVRSRPIQSAEQVLDELMKWICDCNGGDVVFNPKLGLFSSPQPFNTVGLIHKIAELRQRGREREQG